MPPVLNLRNEIEISVELHGEKQTVQSLRRYGQKARLEVARIITRTAMAIQAGAVRRVRGDTGRLRSSIRLYTLEGGLAAAVGTNVKHAKWVEFGTGPLGRRTNRQPLPHGFSHGAAHKQPPIKALIPWVKRHANALGKREIKGTGFGARAVVRKLSSAKRERTKGAGFGTKVVRSASEVEQMAFVIGRAIARRGGNRAQPFLFPAYKEEMPRFYRAIGEAFRKAGGGP